MLIASIGPLALELPKTVRKLPTLSSASELVTVSSITEVGATVTVICSGGVCWVVRVSVVPLISVRVPLEGLRMSGDVPLKLGLVKVPDEGPPVPLNVPKGRLPEPLNVLLAGGNGTFCPAGRTIMFVATIEPVLSEFPVTERNWPVVRSGRAAVITFSMTVLEPALTTTCPRGVVNVKVLPLIPASVPLAPCLCVGACEGAVTVAGAVACGDAAGVDVDVEFDEQEAITAVSITSVVRVIPR